MKVRIIHGNETGTVKDLRQVEAEVAIQTGFAVAAAEPTAAPEEPAKKTPARKPRKPVTAAPETESVGDDTPEPPAAA